MRRRFRIESLEKRQLLAAAVFQVADTAYFPSRTEPAIARYDLATETWLSEVTLESGSVPTAAQVDEAAYYVAFGDSVVRYGLDGSTPEPLFDAAGPVEAIYSDGNVLIVLSETGGQTEATSIDKTTGDVIDTATSTLWPLGHSSHRSSMNQIFGAVPDENYRAVPYLQYDDAGHFQGYSGGPSVQGLPSENNWLSPNEQWLFDNTGAVYSADALEEMHHVSGPVNDVAFWKGHVPVVVSGSSVKAYNNTFDLNWTRQLVSQPYKILTSDANVVAFYIDGTAPSGFRAETIAIDPLEFPTPTDVINPLGAHYAPDQIEVDNDGSLLILSREFNSVFRWDVATEQYTESIPLKGTPDRFSFSASEQVLYLAYPNGDLNRLDLANPDRPEERFVSLPSRAYALVATGDYVVVKESQGDFVSLSTYALDGQKVSSVRDSRRPAEMVYNPVVGAVQFVEQSGSIASLRSVEIDSAGTLGLARKITDSDVAIDPPLVVSPAGDSLLVGAGTMFDSSTLQTLSTSLPTGFVDAAWIGDQLYTVRNDVIGSTIQQWAGPQLTAGLQRESAQEAVALMNSGGLLVSVTQQWWGPAFEVLDPDLQVHGASNAPKMIVGFGAIPLVDGADTVATNNGTDFGYVTRGYDSEERVFVIYNDGDAPLAVSRLSVTDGFELTPYDGVLPTQTQPRSLEPTEWMAFRLKLLSNQVGLKRGTVVIESDDGDHPVFDFAVQGYVVSNGEVDSVGAFDPSSAIFETRDYLGTQSEDHRTAFGQSGGWVPLAGDFDGDGDDTIGVYQPDRSLFHLNDSISEGDADWVVAFGAPNDSEWVPLVGDWDGDGRDTIGLYQPELALFHLVDSLTSTTADHLFAFGPAGNAGWVPLVGDWNGDGVDNIGLYQPDLSLFHLKDSFSGGNADHFFAFGPAGQSGWYPIAGDWNGDGIDTVGLFQDSASLFHLKNSHSGGISDRYDSLSDDSRQGRLPLVGRWEREETGFGSGFSSGSMTTTSVITFPMPSLDFLDAAESEGISEDSGHRSAEIDSTGLKREQSGDSTQIESSEGPIELLDEVFSDWDDG